MTISLLVAPSSLVFSAGGEAPLRAHWEHQRLSVVAEKTPLGPLIQEIARRAGVTVRGHEGLQERVTVSFSAVSLRTAFEKLLAHLNHVIVEELSRGGDPQPSLVLIFKPLDAVTPEREVERVALAQGNTAHLGPAELPDALLDDPNAFIRRWAVERLGERGDDLTLTRLVEALADDDPGVRKGALAGLGQYGETAIAPLKALLERERVPEVRAAALQLFGEMGGPEAADVLGRMLEDRDPEVRIAVIEALGHVTNATATHALMAATKDREPAVRMAAFNTLAFYAPDDAAAAAVEQALLDTDEAVQALATNLVEAVNERTAAQHGVNRSE